MRPDDSRYSRVDRRVQEGARHYPGAAAPGDPARVTTIALIVSAAGRYRIQPALVKAVMAAESNFKPDAVSRVGAQGLMQLMPATARELGVERPFGILENLDGGVRYLRQMLDRYGDVSQALAAYNAGPRAVDQYHGIPPYQETQAYVKRVLEYYRGYRDEFERPTYRAGTRSVAASGR